MRRTIAFVGTLTGLALAAGCGPSVQHLDGPAAPVGAASRSGTPVPETPSAPAASRNSPSASAPTPAKTPAKPGGIAATELVLGPTGLGNLKIGMTVAQAKATGVIVSYREGSPCGYSRLRNAPGDAGQVTHSPGRGVVAITGYGNLRTPEGIRLGSSFDQVRRAYADIDYSEADRTLERGTGRLWANSNDGDNVAYRMSIRGGKVTELGLEHNNQDCYE